MPAVILFGIPEIKDSCGIGNLDPDGPVPAAIRALKKEMPDLLVISDMCFCEYTDHGHCGAINIPAQQGFRAELPEGYLLNDQTLDLLGRASVVHAAAGADVIAPSGMIDGMVGAIRSYLDAAGHDHVAIMSYAAKFASGFYGPFRDAAESPPQFGDRAQYQMDPANVRAGPARSGAGRGRGRRHRHGQAGDALPGCAPRRARRLQPAAGRLSGERRVLDDPRCRRQRLAGPAKCALESLVGIRRAGADMIITYFAKEVAQWLA